MEIVVKIAQLILSLSILVIFHELGHFTFAKIFKTRVEKFYLFFNPWFSIFKFKKGETEYGLGWVPLGGYVKISGMIDESMDKEQMKKPAQPWEFRAKPAWQRLLIMIGGVLVNIILAVFIYIFTLFAWGETYIPNQNVEYGIAVDSLGMEIGLQNGDKIIKVNGNEEDNFGQIIPNLLLDKPKTLTVDRSGEIVKLNISDEQISQIINHGTPFMEPRIPFIISDFTDESVAQKAGLEIDDKIIGLNDKNIKYFDEFRDELQNFKNKEITITVLRNEKEKQFVLTVPETGKIGAYRDGNLSRFFKLEKIEYSLLQSVPAGIRKGYEEIKSYLKQLRLIFTPKTGAYKSVGSFISIGKIFPGQWNWQAFWSLTALLSIMLAVINILPIPALDGGHVMFLFYEIIVGKKPSDKFMEYAQIVGMVILLSLMVLAIGNDFIRHVF